MESLLPIARTIVVAVVIELILRALRPRSRVVYWSPHRFEFNFPLPQPLGANPPHTAAVTTYAITVQNSGKQRAEAIQVVHNSQPGLYGMWPARQHVAGMRTSGPNQIHVIEVSELAPNEFFVLEFISASPPPQFLYVRSRDGYAQHAPVTLQWVVPPWVNRIKFLIYYVGLVFSAYWVVKALEFAWSALAKR